MHKCWSLYNKEEKLRIDDLTKDQVHTILLSIPSAKMGAWYVCQEGDVSWQRLKDIPDFYEEVMTPKGKSLAKPEQTNTSPARGRKRETARHMFADVDMANEVTLEMEAVATKERRSAKRYLRNLIFHANFDKVVFECPTVDISMGGVSLKNSLPAKVPKTFRAELRLDGTAIKVKVSKVSSHALKIDEASAWDLLRQWLVNW